MSPARGIVRLLNTADGRALCLAGEVDADAVDSFIRRYGHEPVRVDRIDAGSVTSLSEAAVDLVLDHLDAAGRAGRPVACCGPPQLRRLLAGGHASADHPERGEARTPVDMKLELVPVPVTDVDRAKAFYAEKMGFTVDVDVRPVEGMRIVQLTPPGSGCSIVVGTGLGGISEADAGSVRGLHLVVADIEAARAELLGRGVDVGDIDDVGRGVRYASITDPDGNTLLLQEMAWRTGDAF